MEKLSLEDMVKLLKVAGAENLVSTGKSKNGNDKWELPDGWTNLNIAGDRYSIAITMIRKK